MLGQKLQKTSGSHFSLTANEQQQERRSRSLFSFMTVDIMVFIGCLHFYSSYAQGQAAVSDFEIHVHGI